MSNQKNFMLRYLEVLRDICSRGLTPRLGYDKVEDVWTVIDETAVEGQVVSACHLKVVFSPGEISYEVSRIMPDNSKMIKTRGVIELEGEKHLDHISAYIEDLRDYGVSD